MKIHFKSFVLAFSTILLLSSSTLFAEGKSKESIPALVEHVPYIKTRVPYDISLEELAERYYNDIGEVETIRKANIAILKNSSMVKKNTEIRLPVTEKFVEQPEHLGWN